MCSGAAGETNGITTGGQDESDAEYLIRHLTEPGQLVVDPFCGSGTIVAAAKKLGRSWLATEMDKNAALVARKRLSQAI